MCVHFSCVIPNTVIPNISHMKVLHIAFNWSKLIMLFKMKYLGAHVTLCCSHSQMLPCPHNSLEILPVVINTTVCIIDLY